MSFQLVPKSVTLNAFERRNRSNGCVISPNLVDFWADYITVVEDTQKGKGGERERKGGKGRLGGKGRTMSVGEVDAAASRSVALIWKVVYINCTMTKLCPWKLGCSVIIIQHV